MKRNNCVRTSAVYSILKKHALNTFLLLSLSTYLSAPAYSANAIYTTGYGAVSGALSGADIAVETDVTAVVTNPATLAFVNTSRGDVYLSAANFYANEHSDQFGNDTNVDKEYAMLFGGGYMWRPEQYPNLVTGVGINVAGGVGYTYDDLKTAFGTEDNAAVALSVIKISPAIAWNVTSKLKLGATIALTYASAEQELFPETSVANTPAGQPFLGIQLEDVSTWTIGARIGAHYQLHDSFELGFAYSPATPLDLDNGNLEMNYQAFGAGKVSYKSARLEGLELPEEVGIGLAWQASPNVKIITEANWFAWGDINRLNLSAKNPNSADPSVASKINLRTSTEFRDRVAYALAIEWQLGGRKVLRAGFSHINQVQPASTVSPTLNFTVENDIAIGLEMPINKEWLINVTAEYEMPRRVTYTNKEMPFGENSGARFGIAYVHFNFTKRK